MSMKTTMSYFKSVIETTIADANHINNRSLISFTPQRHITSNITTSTCTSCLKAL